MRTFKSLTEKEILALAISLEEEDARIYDDIAQGLEDHHPKEADEFRAMRAEEDGHRHRLLDLYRRNFGEHIPLLRRHDIKGFVRRGAVWSGGPIDLEEARRRAQTMEAETKRFYETAAKQVTDVSVRQLLGDLAEEGASTSASPPPFPNPAPNRPPPSAASSSCRSSSRSWPV